MKTEKRQELKGKIDYLILEALRLDRMLLDDKCIEAIAIEPEITAMKNEIMADIESLLKQREGGAGCPANP